MTTKPATKPSVGKNPAKRGLEDLSSDSDTEDEIIQSKKPTDSKDKDTSDGIDVTEEIVKKTKIKRMRPLDEDLLCGPDGLVRIYDEFPKAMKFRGRGFEAKDLKKLTTLYKEWAFQLHPGFAFQDFLMKCETLGTKSRVKHFMDRLREKERDNYIENVMGIKPRREESPLKTPSKYKPSGDGSDDDGLFDDNNHGNKNNNTTKSATISPGEELFDYDLLFSQAAAAAEAEYLKNQQKKDKDLDDDDEEEENTQAQVETSILDKSLAMSDVNDSMLWAGGNDISLLSSNSANKSSASKRRIEDDDDDEEEFM